MITEVRSEDCMPKCRPPQQYIAHKLIIHEDGDRESGVYEQNWETTPDESQGMMMDVDWRIWDKEGEG